MSKGPAPLVTGVSPKEGPPGTRIIIRGENLGLNPRDLVGVKICGVECLFSCEWITPSKIIARTGPGKGKGDIIVMTMSGGQGSCTVGFRGYFMQIGPVQDSAVWIDETQSVPALVGRGHHTASPITVKDTEDPLGISDEGNTPKFTEGELLDLFPEASGNLTLENFSPTWYLLENHHSTSFDDLRKGLDHMKSCAPQRSEGPIAFIKSNLSSTLECQDSLADMYKQFLQDDIRGSCMNSYAVLLMQAKSCADGLFKEVLGRKDKADSTRNALSVLQRFRFLFHLPITIERNIQKGDYNLVINDYIRAKSLFADTPVQVFKKVYKEVEDRISRFRTTLHQKLIELPSTLDEQKKLIRYLVNLEYAGDAAWECMKNQQQWLLQLLIECKDEHLEQEMSFQVEAENMGNVPGSTWRGLTSPHRQTSMTSVGNRQSASFASSMSPEQTGWRFRTPQKVLYVEELTEIISEHFPDFWKLGQAYFSGNLLLRESTEKPAKVDPTKHSNFKQMIMELSVLFSNLVRAAFLPKTLENYSFMDQFGVWPENKYDVPGSWLPPCVRHIRSCVSSLSKLDLPSDSQDLLNELAFDMRTNCMTTLLKQAIDDVRSLHTRESWVVETDDEFGGTTQLPILFENIVNETVQHLHEVVVQVKSGEPEIFSQRPIQIELTDLCTELLQAFSSCLENLALGNNQSNTSLQIASMGTSMSHDDQDDTLPPLDKRAIMMLSNCNHTVERVLPRLVENLDKHGYLEMNKALKAAEVTYLKLDAKLFESYVEEKSNPIIGAIEQNMYMGQFDWNSCPNPTGVRSYLKQTLMGIIEVHAEVFAVSPVFLTRVMSKVVEGVVEELSRLITCTSKYSAHGSLQARLEVTALRDALKLYITQTSEESLEEALSALPANIPINKRTLDELLNVFKSQMHFQLMCFQPDNVMARTSKLA